MDIHDTNTNSNTKIAFVQEDQRLTWHWLNKYGWRFPAVCSGRSHCSAEHVGLVLYWILTTCLQTPPPTHTLIKKTCQHKTQYVTLSCIPVYKTVTLLSLVQFLYCASCKTLNIINLRQVRQLYNHSQAAKCLIMRICTNMDNNINNYEYLGCLTHTGPKCLDIL